MGKSQPPTLIGLGGFFIAKNTYLQKINFAKSLFL